MLPDQTFVLLNQLQICFAEKNTLVKSVEIMAPLLLKFLATPLNTYHCPLSLNQSEKSHGAKENRLHSKYLSIYR